MPEFSVKYPKFTSDYFRPIKYIGFWKYKQFCFSAISTWPFSALIIFYSYIVMYIVHILKVQQCIRCTMCIAHCMSPYIWFRAYTQHTRKIFNMPEKYLKNIRIFFGVCAGHPVINWSWNNVSNLLSCSGHDDKVNATSNKVNDKRQSSTLSFKLAGLGTDADRVGSGCSVSRTSTHAMVDGKKKLVSFFLLGFIYTNI